MLNEKKNIDWLSLQKLFQKGAILYKFDMSVQIHIVIISLYKLFTNPICHTKLLPLCILIKIFWSFNKTNIKFV